MIDNTGKAICDKEIWSRSKNMWIGCRCPATHNKPSKYIISGLDYCNRHRGRNKTGMQCSMTTMRNTLTFLASMKSKVL